MSQFNELLHGAAEDAAAILSGDNPPDSIDDLRAALTNALNRIQVLEERSLSQAKSIGRLGTRTRGLRLLD